ncbi:MAG: hypothetical protein Q7R49_02110 [Candidatus Daviesbacteria bacterium]|nr:hypothetical protein [Candidatus Daviesbacteria bacterium]
MRQEFLNSETVFREEYLDLDGQTYQIKSTGFEPTDPKYGFSVENFRFIGDNSRDLAKATVFPRRCTPPQLVERAGDVIDIPFRGSGRFIYLVPGETNAREIKFHAVSVALRNFKVTYRRGLYQCWIAGANGLEFAEICEPSYEKGDMTNLDLEKDSVPEAFKIAVMRGIWQLPI